MDVTQGSDLVITNYISSSIMFCAYILLRLQKEEVLQVFVNKASELVCVRLKEHSWLLGHLTSQLGKHRYDTTLLSLLWKVMDILIVCLQFWMLSNDSSSLYYVRFFAFLSLEHPILF
ncbi:hypothetical protein ACB092_04G026000 [Castanea dentata]